MDAIHSNYKSITNQAESRKKLLPTNLSTPSSLQLNSIKSRNMRVPSRNPTQDTSKLLTKPQLFRTVSEQRISKIPSNASIVFNNEIKPKPLDRPLPSQARISCPLPQSLHSISPQVSLLKATADKKPAKNVEVSQMLSLLSKEIQPCPISLHKQNDLAKHRYLIYEGNNSELIKKLLELRSNWYEGYYSMPNAASFIWSPTSSNIRFKRLKPSCSMQFVNHFEYHCEISNKSRLFNNLSSFCNANKLALSNIVPATFVIDFKNGYYEELRAFKRFMINASCKNLPSTHYVGKNIWIMKPAGFNRGRGISVFNDLDVLDELSKDILSAKKPGSNVYVIQKYIEKPLLVNNRKFDIRVWVLVSQNDNCYFFPEGYLRTSSQPFTLDHLESKFIHLTNNAIQKDGAEYGKFEAGNQMSFNQFQRYLSNTHKEAKLSRIIKQMKHQAMISLQAAKGKLNPKSRQGCFEIFGYDFIIDSDLKAWLIEVNTNPCLELSSPLLEQIIPRMLNDALELTVGSIFLSARKPLNTPSVLDLPPENLWEFLINIGASD